jgi:triacylglycerol lipase
MQRWKHCRPGREAEGLLVSAEGSRSRHRVDAELLPWLDAWVVPELSAATLADFRALMRPGCVPAELLARTELQVREAPGWRGVPAVELAIMRPKGAAGPLPAVLHFHGGGFIAGGARDEEAAHRALVDRLHCVWVSVGYRLAPEVPCPGALDDGQAAFAWLHTRAAELGIDPQRIGLAGVSAGGGLAAGLALRLRDASGPRPAFLYLVYPMLDDRSCTRAEPHSHAGEFIWTAANNSFAWAAWLGQRPGSDSVDVCAAPGRASDLHGLPPTFIATGALDLFLDENLAFAQRLLHAGVPTEFHIYPGAFHGFDLHPTARVARNARRDSEAALQRMLNPTG